MSRESNARMITPIFTIIETNARCGCGSLLIRDGEALQDHYTAKNGQLVIRLCSGCYKSNSARLLNQRFNISKITSVK